MKLLARILGVLLILFGLMGLAATSLARGMTTTTPALEGMEWTGPVRAAADWVIFALFLPSGALLLRLWPARLVLALTFFLCAVRLAFDWFAADLSTARGETILHGDVVALLVSAVALALGALAESRYRSKKSK